MKKTIILAALGLSAGVVSSFAQGAIGFSSYYADGIGSGLTTVTFGANTQGYSGLVGGGTSAGLFKADVIWSLSPISSGDESAGNGDLTAGWNLSSASPSQNSMVTLFATGTAPGYFAPSVNFLLNPYTAGTTVYFEVIGYNGADYASSTIRGHSAEFSATLATGAIQPASSPVYSSWTISAVPVPEPSTLALAGIGGFGMLMALRRKKA